MKWFSCMSFVGIEILKDEVGILQAGCLKLVKIPKGNTFAGGGGDICYYLALRLLLFALNIVNISVGILTKITGVLMHFS